VTLLVLAAAVAAGSFLALALIPAADWKPRWAVWLLAVSLGAGLGAGIDSCLYFLLPKSTALSIAIPFAVLLASAALWFTRRRKPLSPAPQPERPPAFRWSWALSLVFAAGLLLAFGGILGSLEANPHGQWDAWSIWNVRAKFLTGPGNTWRNAFSPLLNRTHPEYPVLLSSFIALQWRASGEDTALAPAATAVLFFAAALGLLISSLALLRGTSAAWLAGLVALTNTSFLLQPAGLYADVPLGFYYLATLVMVFLAHATNRPALLVAAGVFASCAAWIKDEGMAFLACVLVCYLAIAWRSHGLRAGVLRWSRLLLGALPGILLTLQLKLFLAPATGPVLSRATLARFGEAARYAELVRGLAVQIYGMASPLVHPVLLLAILALALGFHIPRERHGELVFGGLTLALVFAAYCVVYLASPNLGWRVSTSLARLYAQLWPAFLLLVFMALRRVEDRVPQPAR
jgi:hypothetical protein